MNIIYKIANYLKSMDVVFPVLHGLYGEGFELKADLLNALKSS